MSISKYNSEGYMDLTAYEALVAVEGEGVKPGFRPVVFICSPYAGNMAKNVQNARRYCSYAVRENRIPIAPHLLFPQFMNDRNPAQRRLAIFMGLVLLSKCKELWCFGDEITSGMSVEMEKAKKRNIPIRRFTTECVEVDTD